MNSVICYTKLFNEVPFKLNSDTVLFLQSSIGVVTGWGRNENNEYPSVLQQTRLAVVTNEECENHYTDDNLKVESKHSTSYHCHVLYKF